MKKQLLILLLVCVSGLCGMFRGSSVLAAVARRTASGSVGVSRETPGQKLFRDFDSIGYDEKYDMIAWSSVPAIEECLALCDIQSHRACISDRERNCNMASKLEHDAYFLRDFLRKLEKAT